MVICSCRQQNQWKEAVTNRVTYCHILAVSSHCILPCPFPGSLLILWPVCFVDVCNFRNQRVVWVRVSQQGTDGEQYLGNGQSRAPLLFQNVQANAALAVDIWVVNLCLELHFWGLERVIRREVNHYKEHTTRVWTISRPHDSSLPVKQVIT